MCPQDAELKRRSQSESGDWRQGHFGARCRWCGAPIANNPRLGGNKGAVPALTDGLSWQLAGVSKVVRYPRVTETLELSSPTLVLMCFGGLDQLSGIVFLDVRLLRCKD